MSFDFILLVMLRYILPYSLMLGSLFLVLELAQQSYQKASADKAWHKWVGRGIALGVAAVLIYWVTKQPFWASFTALLTHFRLWLQTVPLIGQLTAQVHALWLAAVGIFHRWFIYYLQAFTVVYFLGAIVETFALAWQLSFVRTLNVLLPTVAELPFLMSEWLSGRQTPVADAILARKLKAKFRENLNDSFERAAQGFDVKGEKYDPGAGGTPAEQTKKQTAVAMKRVKVTVKTDVNNMRIAHVVVHQSRETETDRSIEGAIKGIGERISGNSIYFPSDPIYSQKEKGFVFNSSVSYEAGRNLGSFLSIFTNPFSPLNSKKEHGEGYISALKGIWTQTWIYLAHFTPFAIFARFRDAADQKFFRDMSSEKAKYQVAHNLDLSVVPEPKSDQGMSINEAKEAAMRYARSRVKDVTSAISSVKLSGQFKNVIVGGNTAVYEYTLPPDPQLPSDFDRAGKQIGNILQIKQTPAVSISAGILSVTVTNGQVTIPVSFADMIKRRKRGVATPLAGMTGVDAMGEPIYFELNMGDLPHAMLFGATGSGKTVLIDDIIYSMMDAVGPDRLRIAYVDGKGNSFGFMAKDSPHPNPYTFAMPGDASKDVPYSRALLRYLEEFVRDRIATFGKAQVQKLSEYNDLMKKQGEPELPEILLVFDEFSAVLDKDNDLKPGQKRVIDTMQYLAKMARSTGVHILAANQTARKQAVPGIFAANMPGRVSSRVAEPLEAEIALPLTGLRPDLINTPGEHYSLMNGGASNPQHGNSPYLPQSVMNDLNDKLTEKFGPCEYMVSREEIMKYADEPDGEEADAVEETNAPVPSPVPTSATTPEALKALMPTYNQYLYDHRKELILNNEGKTVPNVMQRMNNARVLKALMDALTQWHSETEQAEQASGHRSQGSAVATQDLVRQATVGNDQKTL